MGLGMGLGLREGEVRVTSLAEQAAKIIKSWPLDPLRFALAAAAEADEVDCPEAFLFASASCSL